MYPPIEPYEHGWLDVGDGHRVYWEVCGNPQGRPAVVLHGGPGSGCTEWHRRLFDPAVFQVVLFDQRGCGRSLPYAGGAEADLSANTTWKLIGDIERLREHLGIESWMVVGGSWGSTLGLAYAERHRERVTAMALFGVTTGRWSEIDWLFRGGVSIFFPEQWERLREGLPGELRAGDVVEGYATLLNDGDEEVRRKAAEAWCLWESATPGWPPATGLAPRFQDPEFALCFARLVTHYVRHNAWLEDGALIRGAAVLQGLPGVLVNGRYDFQSPIGNAWTLKRAWPEAELVVVDEAGHDASAVTMTEALMAGIARLGGRSAVG